MTKYYARLSLVILLGTLGLGLSFQAQALDGLIVDWVSAPKGLDCPSTCKKTLLHAFPTGIDSTGKISFYTCLAFGNDKWGHGSRVGFNRNGESSCITVVDSKMYHSKGYYCQCTNNPRPRIPNG